MKATKNPLKATRKLLEKGAHFFTALYYNGILLYISRNIDITKEDLLAAGIGQLL